MVVNNFPHILSSVETVERVNTLAVDFSNAFSRGSYPTRREQLEFVKTGMGVKMEHVEEVQLHDTLNIVFLTFTNENHLAEVEEKLRGGCRFLHKNVKLYGWRCDKPVTSIRVKWAPSYMKRKQMLACFGKYGEVLSCEKGTCDVLSTPVHKVRDGTWLLRVRLDEGKTMPSLIYYKKEVWQVVFDGMVFPCWKCLGLDHRAHQCRGRRASGGPVTFIPERAREYAAIFVDEEEAVDNVANVVDQVQKELDNLKEKAVMTGVDGAGSGQVSLPKQKKKTKKRGRKKKDGQQSEAEITDVSDTDDEETSDAKKTREQSPQTVADGENVTDSPVKVGDGQSADSPPMEVGAMPEDKVGEAVPVSQATTTAGSQVEENQEVETGEELPPSISLLKQPTPEELEETDRKLKEAKEKLDKDGSV